MGLRKVGDDIWEVRYQVRRRFRGKARALLHKKSLSSSLTDAGRRYTTNNDVDNPCCSIGERLEEFLSDSASGLGRRPCEWATVRRHRRRLEAFNRTFRCAPIDCISRKMLERWIKRRLKKVCRDTVNADVGSLRAFARWAQRKSYAPAILEFMLVERLQERGKLAGANRKPPKALTMPEMRRNIQAVAAYRDDIGLFLRGMVLFGLRPAGVSALLRSDVMLPQDGDFGNLHCKGLKGRPDRDIPFAAGSEQDLWVRACLALGNSLKCSGKDAPLVPCRVGKTGCNRRGWTSARLGMALRRVCNRFKIRFTAYQIRHTCISWMQTHGFSLAAVAVYADHSKIHTQEAYSHIRMQDGLPAYERMGSVLGA